MLALGGGGTPGGVIWKGACGWAWCAASTSSRRTTTVSFLMSSADESSATYCSRCRSRPSRSPADACAPAGGGCERWAGGGCERCRGGGGWDGGRLETEAGSASAGG